MSAIGVGFCACAAMLAGHAASGQTLVQLPPLTSGGWVNPAGLSDDGMVVGGSAATSATSYTAFRWTPAGGMVSLGRPSGGDHSYGYGISGDGNVVVGAGGGAAYDQACRWSAASGMASMGGLASGQPSFAFDANFDGTVVVGDGYLANSAQRAFKWTPAGGYQVLTQLLPGTAHSVGLATNASGSVVTGYCFNNAPNLVYPTACIWSGAAVTSIGMLPGTQMSVPGDVSADGTVVVGYCADGTGGNSRAFRWTSGGGMQDLGGIAGASASVSTGMTADGGTVVGYSVVGGGTVAWIWTSGSGAVALDSYFAARGVATAGWTFGPTSISANGTAFTGWGATHNGVSAAWYLGNMSSCTLPSFTLQPLEQTYAAGGTVTYTIAVADPTGTTYQWRHDLAEMAGERGTSLTLTGLSALDLGTYDCVATNGCGSTASQSVMLTLPCTAPEFVMQPLEQAYVAGGSVTYVVELADATGATYQWRHDFADIPGETGATLTLTGLGSADMGMYDCVATNGCGSTASQSVRLGMNCGADFNDDGVIDFFDYLDFVDEFSAGALEADFNRDGVVDFFDYLDFVDAFASGC